MNNQKIEIILFSISLFSFCSSVLYQVWRVSASVAAIRHNLEKQDIRLENLHEVHELAFNGFREKMEHFTTRSKSELQELDQRLEAVENFLQKTTAFEKR